MFNPIPASLIQVGKALKKEIFDLIRNNFDDIEARLLSVEAGVVSLDIFNGVIKPLSSFNHKGIAYYNAIGQGSVTEAFIQIYEVNGFTGTLEIDILKSVTDLNNSSFVSIFDVKPSINLSTASDYAKSVNQILGTGAALDTGDILRLDITAMPIKGSVPNEEVYPKFNIKCFGG
jgi:hypothetical protein